MFLTNDKLISTTELYWRKFQGCYGEFGLLETIRRTLRELIRSPGRSVDILDVSLVTENLVIGAAPRSSDGIKRLKVLGFSYVIDLRAERKQSDILVQTQEISVSWVPTYDDWRHKSAEFYRDLTNVLNSILNNGEKLLVCCGAGEHRAPLAGVLALVTIGYSLEAAVATVQEARTGAELLPVYISSLVEFLENNHLPAGSPATGLGTGRQLATGKQSYLTADGRRQSQT